MDYTPPDFLKHHVPGGWIPAQGIPKILEFYKNLKGIEIGSCYGTSTHYLLENLPELYITAVDPYEEYEQMPERDKAFESFQKVCELFPNRVALIRLRSDDAVDKFEDESIDFIFIDGFHSNEQVKKDIENYYPKLKSGGLISGHDYNAWQLQPSVNEMAAHYKKEVLFTEQDVWYWFK